MTSSLVSSSRVARPAACALLAASLLVLPIRAEAAPPPNVEAGEFLSAQWAQHNGDRKQAAAYLENVLKHNPDRPDIVRQLISTYLWLGDFKQATKLAAKIEAPAPQDLIPILVQVTDAVKNGRYEKASDLLKPLAADQGPARAIILPFVQGWVDAGRDDLKAMESDLKPLEQQQGLAILRHWHLGLAAMQAGDKKLADQHFGDALKMLEAPSLRLTEIYADLLRRMDADQRANDLIARFAAASPRHPLTDWLTEEKTVSAPVKSAKDGLAEAYFDLAGLIRREEGDQTSILLLRLSLELRPKSPVVQLLLADILSEEGTDEDAAAIYEKVSDDTPLGFQAELSRAEILARLGKQDEAVALLKKLSDRDKSRYEAPLTLGHVLRSQNKFQEAAAAYSTAIDRLGKPLPQDWVIFYARGIAYERGKDWEKAEPDFLKALELQPDQPQVSNYLAYSWLEHGKNFAQAETMLKKAITARPDDGAIVDSLGWAYYRQGRYEEAVIQLERAAELLPSDATINDHLGDALWQVGRKAEAGYQWQRALLFKPEPELVPGIQQKLKSGLPAAEATPVQPTNTGQPGTNPSSGG